MAMPQCCYLAKGGKRPSHTTNMQPFQLSLFTFGTQLSAFGKFVKVICLGLNCRGTQLTLFAFGTQFVLGLNLFWDSIVASPIEPWFLSPKHFWRMNKEHGTLLVLQWL